MILMFLTSWRHAKKRLDEMENCNLDTPRGTPYLWSNDALGIVEFIGVPGFRPLDLTLK